ncbi:histidine kinase [Lewinella sp. 4G2]|uniref:histidine kinase n=1 Tax=Lewinella sp. 4G2 TaxID=1803372 RepID=UPI0018D2ECE4|nr:histidine kinase [Lewinella sp. 4G2]
MLFFLGLLLCSCDVQEVQLFPVERSIKLGDDATWSDPDLDDADWISASGVEGHTNYWVRFRTNWTAEQLAAIETKGLRIVSIGTYEAYWDGVAIGGSGVVGTDENTEVPGRFTSYLRLPDSLDLAGDHVLALRVAHFHGPPYASWHTFYLGEYFQLGRTGLLVAACMLILGGMFLSAGIYYLLLFFRGRDPARLIFGLMCLLFFGLLIMEYWKFLYAYEYTFHYTRLLAIGIMTLILALLTPWFFLVYFDTPKKRWLLLLYAASLGLYLTTVELRYDTTVQAMSIVAWLATILITAFAVWKKLPESRLLLLILLLFYAIPWVVAQRTFNLLIFDYDISLFLSFALLVIVQLYLLARRSQTQQLAYEAGLTRASRLENELLRKNIQPHFLLNTLTSLIDWVEESPAKSVEFIEALSEEFMLFHSVADKESIPLSQALLLCRSHLRVMEFRKEISYEWTEANLDPEAKLPPGILLTLVENGVTHSKPDEQGRVRFHLRAETAAGSGAVTYELTVFARPHATARSTGTGTGMAYIHSRLEESFGSQWSLTDGPIEGGWRTTITFPIT